MFRAALFALTIATTCGCAQQATPAAPYPRAAVAADHEIASRAGVEILRQGGNAVDAAVATSFTLSVVRPYSCGIGGGGFMIIRFRDDAKFGTRSVAINYRERAPVAVGADFYEALPTDASRIGGKAVGVPGAVAGVLHALERYGTLDRQAVLAPAIRAADEGFVLDSIDIANMRGVLRWYQEDPSRQTRYPFVWKRFLKEGNAKPGDKVVLPEQAEALRLIAQHGRSAFYEGPIAEAIVSAVRDDGGVMTMDDLRAYSPQEVAPLQFAAMGCTFLTMPPPSSGGVAMAEALGIIAAVSAGSPSTQPAVQAQAARIHLVVEAWKNAFADRARWMGDPEFVDVPVARLTSPEYARSLAAKFAPDRTLPIEAYGSIPPDDHGTSHFSVVDERGNAVACTETINLEFGAILAVDRFGFALNDEMDDFTTKRGQANAFGLRQSQRNAPAPGKRPLSSMTPTIVLNPDGTVRLIAGASGGPKIITGTMQAIMNVLAADMSAEEAVSAPRYHHQWMPDVIQMERKLYSEAEHNGLNEALSKRGHKLEASGSVGIVQLIRRVPGGWDAASDPRKGGKPAGY